MSLSKIATCLTVTVTRSIGWQQTSSNKQASEVVASTNNANRKSVSVQTALLGDLPTCQEIIGISREIGKQMRLFGVPIADAKYLIPASRIESVIAYLKSEELRLNALKSALAYEYPHFVANQEQTGLGGLYQANKYADVVDVLEGTAIKYEIDTLCDSSQFSTYFNDSNLIAELAIANDGRLSKLADDVIADLSQLLEKQVLRTLEIVEGFHAGGGTDGGKRMGADSVVAKLLQTTQNVKSLNDTMFASPNATIENSVDAIFAAIPKDAETLKDGKPAKQFCDAMKRAIGLYVAPVVVAPVVVAPVVVAPVYVAPAMVYCSVDDF